MLKKQKPSIFNALESFVLLSTFIFTEQFDRNLDLDGVAPSLQRNILEVLHEFLASMTEPNHALGIALIAIFVVSTTLAIIGYETRKINDILAAYLSLAWLVELLTMNVLLLSPLKHPTLLLIELLLFIPVVITAFSWWYWRINYSGNHNKETAAITFSHDKPLPVDYLMLSIGVLIKNNVTSHSLRTKTAKFTALANSIVALDVLGLTLSRAVSLAIR